MYIHMYIPIYSFIYLSIYLSTCLSLYLSIYLSVWVAQLSRLANSSNSLNTPNTDTERKRELTSTPDLPVSGLVPHFLALGTQVTQIMLQAEVARPTLGAEFGLHRFLSEFATNYTSLNPFWPFLAPDPPRFQTQKKVTSFTRGNF